MSVLSSAITKGQPYRSVRVGLSDGPVIRILCTIIFIVFVAVVVWPKLRCIVTSDVRLGNGIDTLVTALGLQLVIVSRKSQALSTYRFIGITALGFCEALQRLDQPTLNALKLCHLSLCASAAHNTRSSVVCQQTRVVCEFLTKVIQLAL